MINQWIIIDPINYVNIDYNYYRCEVDCVDKKTIEFVEKNKKKEFDKFMVNLNNIYIKMINNPKHYAKMSKSANKKVNTLSNERIYQYIYKGIVHNSKYIK